MFKKDYRDPFTRAEHRSIQLQEQDQFLLLRQASFTACARHLAVVLL